MYGPSMLNDVRTFGGGRVSRPELLSLIAAGRDEATVARMAAAVGELDDLVLDAAVADGDLRVPGDLHLADAGLFLLIVRGDLLVGGAYGDSDHPETFLLVTGDMRARDVVTAGWLEVHGDLRANRVVGDYNDCGARIGGNVHARLFHGEQHHFTIGGELLADVVVGPPRLAIAREPAYLDVDDPRLLDHLDHDLLRVLDDEDLDGNPVTVVDGIRDFRALKRRVLDGLPLRTR